MRAPVSNDQFTLHPFNKREAGPFVSRELSPVESPAPAEPTPVKSVGIGTRIVGMIRRRWITLLAATVPAVIITSIVLHFVTPLYTSSAQLMVQKTEITNSPDSAEQRDVFMRSEENLIVSTPVLATALATPGIHEMAAVRGLTDDVKSIKQQLRVEPGRGEDLVNLSFDAANPDEGTKLVAAIIDSYIRFRSSLQGSMTDGSLAAIQRERNKAQQELNQRWTKLQQFGAEHGLAQGDEQVDASKEALHAIALKLAQAHVETVSTQAEYDQVQHDLRDDPATAAKLSSLKDAGSSMDGGDENAISKQIVALRSQLAGLGVRFMSNYPAVQLINRRIDDLKVTRDAIIQDRWTTSVRRERELQNSYDQQQNAASADATNQKLYDEQKATVADAKKNVDLLDARLKELDPTNKAVTTLVTVVEPPTPTDRPTKPRSFLIMLAVAAVGLTVGFGVAATQDAREGLESTGERKSFIAGMPLLARLPAVQRRQLAMGQWRDKMVDSATEFAEACRKIHRTLDGVASSTGGTTLLVTSTNSREGKSTLVSLLALTMARTGKRVLLVDANMYSPAQGNSFGIAEEYGLGNLLDDEDESNFHQAIFSAGDEMLDIMLAGTTEGSPENLLNSQKFTNLLAEMAGEYDYLLIDSPALAVGSDARIIAGSCDATIVLARESTINRKVLQKTRDGLTNVGGNVIGIVVNGGTEAIASNALVRIDVSAHAPIKVEAVRHTVKAEQIEADFSAEVVEPSEVRSAPAPEMLTPENELTQPLGSRLLLLIFVLAGWAVLHQMGLSSVVSHTAVAVHVAPVARVAVPAGQMLVTLPMLAAGLVVVMLIAAFSVKPPKQDIGLMVAATGLALWSMNGGTGLSMRNAIQHGAMIAPMVEVCVMFGTLLLAWSLVRGKRDLMQLFAAEGISGTDGALGIFAHACAMSALMILLSKSDSKIECIAVIGFSSCLASMIAYWMAPVGSSLCFWLSPLVVATFGYSCAFLTARGVQFGPIAGALGSLARPLPIDYASMGPIGAVMGFWIASSGRRTGKSMGIAQ